MNYLWWVGKYLEVFFDTWLCTLFGRKFCKDWDKRLLQIMEEGELLGFSKGSYGGGTYTVNMELGGTIYKIWIENQWYSYGYNYAETNYNKQFRPSIKTMIKLEKWVNELQEMEENNK